MFQTEGSRYKALEIDLPYLASLLSSGVIFRPQCSLDTPLLCKFCVSYHIGNHGVPCYLHHLFLLLKVKAIELWSLQMCHGTRFSMSFGSQHSIQEPLLLLCNCYLLIYKSVSSICFDILSSFPPLSLPLSVALEITLQLLPLTLSKTLVVFVICAEVTSLPQRTHGIAQTGLS